jgi:tetratricopeptide (TPR) repeat protein
MMNLAMALDRLDEYDDIPELIVKTMKCRPNKPGLLQSAEGILERLLNEGSLPIAKKYLEGWVEAMPKNVSAWHNLGLVTLSLKDLDLAITCFKRVEQLDPSDNFSIYQLAKIYAQIHKGQDCLDYCNKLIVRRHETLHAVYYESAGNELHGRLQSCYRIY